MIFTADELALRRTEIDASADLRAIRAHLRGDLEQFLHRPAYVPERKALLSRWGSLCRDCHAELTFDPYSPDVQQCTGCGRAWSTEQTQRWWIYWYQLWLAERVLMCAVLDRLDNAPDCAAKAGEALALIAQRYAGWPNQDNVLGPSRPFFSTYLESIWSLHLATAASLLEPSLGASLTSDLVEQVFRPSAAIISDFDEARSNRQVWNAAALYALGRITKDAALADRAAHGPSGIIATLDAGLLDDGLWYEGENYHWFALRGIQWGAALLRATGDRDLWTADDAPGRKLRAAFHAPVLTVLPDFTFPARRDSKFGVSLRQRRMAELWEIALAKERDPGRKEEYASLLSHIYDPSVAEVDGAAGLISDVERNEPAGGVRRTALGWKALAWALPELPSAPGDAWRPGSALLEATGLAVFRRDEGRTYVSLDYGESGGGHGHPDRLNLTWVADGVPWLLDFGTGSYVSQSLAWYRSTVAHNAPLLDNASQAAAYGVCVAYEEQPRAGWICAQLPEDSAYGSATLQRTVVVTERYIVDVLQVGSSAGERLLVLPWHGMGDVAADERGLTFTSGERRMRVLLAGRQPFQVQFGEGYGPPTPAGEPEGMRFAVAVASGEEITLAACLTTATDIEEIDCVEDGYVVRFTDGRVHVHGATEEGWKIELERGDPIELGGLRDIPEAPPAPLRRGGGGGLAGMLTGSAIPMAGKQPEAAAHCRAVKQTPALDGSLDGFDLSAPLVLDKPEQFRRAEEPWEGADAFSAKAWLNHDDEALYLAVEVRASAPVFRETDAPNPELDNENPDINTDGIQVYVGTSLFYGWVVGPDPADHETVRATPVGGTDAEADMVTGGWQESDRGYRLTLRLALPEALDGFGFDLLVNRAREGRQRRTGQLVWSGARGARLFLAGDRPMDGELPWVKVE